MQRGMRRQLHSRAEQRAGGAVRAARGGGRQAGRRLTHSKRQVPCLHLVLPYQPAGSNNNNGSEWKNRAGMQACHAVACHACKPRVRPPAQCCVLKVHTPAAASLEQAGGGACPAIDQPVDQPLRRQLLQACRRTGNGCFEVTTADMSCMYR